MRSPEPAAPRIVAWVVALGLIPAALQVGGVLAVRGWLDGQQYVSEQRLIGALKIFRPSDRSGLAQPQSRADLSSEAVVRSDPRHCSALVVLGADDTLGGAGWTGINGPPAQPVRTLTVRFADASTARQALRQKRLALRGCRTVQLTFPPFDQPAQSFTVSSASRGLGRSDRLTYRLGGQPRDYVFYLRRYGNTLTWTYGDTDGTAVRREVVDDLAGTLAELGRR